MKEVSASEFARNFGLYREIAQREPVAVTSHGRTTGYFVSAVEFDEWQRLKASLPHARKIDELSEAEIERIAQSRMSDRHDHLDQLLDASDRQAR